MIAMLPRLQAEEALAAASVAALGAGTMKPARARAVTRELQRASGRRRPRAADPRVLAAMGIAVVEGGSPAPAGAEPREAPSISPAGAEPREAPSISPAAGEEE